MEYSEENEMEKLEGVKLISNKLFSVDGRLVLTTNSVIFVPYSRTNPDEVGDKVLISPNCCEIPYASIYDVIVCCDKIQKSLKPKIVITGDTLLFVGKNCRKVRFKIQNINGLGFSKFFITFQDIFFSQMPQKGNGRTSLISNFRSMAKNNRNKINHIMRRVSSNAISMQLNVTNYFSKIKVTRQSAQTSTKADISPNDPADSIESSNILDVFQRYSCDELRSEQPLEFFSQKVHKMTWETILSQEKASNLFSITMQPKSETEPSVQVSVTPLHVTCSPEEVKRFFTDSSFPRFSYYHKKRVMYTCGMLKDRKVRVYSGYSILSIDQSDYKNILPQLVIDGTISSTFKTKDSVALNIQSFLPAISTLQKSYLSLSDLCCSIGWKSVDKTLHLINYEDYNSSSPNEIMNPLLIRKYSKKAFLTRLDSSKWLHKVGKILLICNEVASLFLSYNVFICEETPLYSCIVMSIIKIMMSSFYRTTLGFWNIIYQEWIGQGYNFTKHITKSTKLNGDFQALFILFLDCVYQLTLQYPYEFEFNSSFLIAVSDAAFSGLFVEFSTPSINSSKDFPPIFSVLSLNSVWDRFINPLYLFKCHKNSSQEKTQLIADTHLCSIILWDEYFLRWSQGYTHISEEYDYFHFELYKLINEYLSKNSNDFNYHVNLLAEGASQIMLPSSPKNFIAYISNYLKESKSKTIN